MPSKPSASQAVLPSWLTNEFLGQNLQQYFEDETLKVIDFSVKSATANGENFASSLHRLTVALNKIPRNQPKAELSIIVKVGLCDDYAFGLLTSLDAIDKEPDFYRRIAPKIKELLQQLNETDSLLPETYGVCKTPNVILFEDMLTRNYGTVSTRQGFTVAETKMVFKKAALFHAINAVIQQNHPDIFANYGGGLINQTVDGFNNHFLAQIEILMDMITGWADFPQMYVQKLKNLRENFVEKYRRAYAPNPTQFNTLTHGDMWASNLMVKHCDAAKTKIENTIFIDFQFSCWASPAIDLNYFICTSMEDSLRNEHRDELLEFYHEHLVDRLTELKYLNHIPTLDEFKQQFFDRPICGFVITCLVQPYLIADYDEPTDFELMFSCSEKSIESKRKILSSPKVKEILEKYIPYYDRLGVFD